LIVDDNSRRDSDSSRYRSTTVLLKATLGSEQYHATKSSIANRYDLFDSGERRVFRTALFAKSRSGSLRTRFGLCFGFLRLTDERSLYPLVKSNQIASIDRNAVLRAQRPSRRPCIHIPATLASGVGCKPVLSQHATAKPPLHRARGKWTSVNPCLLRAQDPDRFDA
jgi:hypothetical protein